MTIITDSKTKESLDVARQKVVQLETLPNGSSKALEICLHDLIKRQCRGRLEAEAVCAWDGNFTYQQLENHAAGLAASLQRYQIAPETFVPILFEKSRWTVVAVLAVLQAGGAFVLLDPSLPQQRLGSICAKIQARVLISSRQQASHAAQLVPDIVILGDEHEPARAGEPRKTKSDQVQPFHAAYAIFTSGSTGIPKGVVIEHRSISTSCVSHGAALALNESSRVLQFTAYSFDICLLEMMTVLVYGGCICIPSDSDRQANLVDAARQLTVNWASLTPSVARTIAVDEVPFLKTLVFVGEAARQDDLYKWQPHVRLFNAFGPAECAVLASVHEYRASTEMPTNIGIPAGSSCWVVEVDDLETLATIGTVGELLIDGPIVGRGYLGEREKTAEVFIDRPRWLQQREPDTTRRLYRTGDLACYHADETIQYLGRKDTQVKISGQRLELLEVEYHLRQSLFTADGDLAVEMVTPVDDADSPLLVAFIFRDAGMDSAADDAFSTEFASAQRQLQRQLPTYMIPTTYISLTTMPLNNSGKLNRQRLREIGSSKTRRELHHGPALPHGKPNRTPSNSIEAALQQLWAEVLQMSPMEIGLEDNFWQLGGSSIRAMKLAGAARQRGYGMLIQDIWDSQTLEQMADKVQSRMTGMEPAVLDETVTVPYSLLPNKDLLQSLRAQCDLQAPAEVEDVYPCTPLQEGLFSLSSQRPEVYTVQEEYSLPSSIDVVRFQRAWVATIDANPILRTRIVQASDGLLYQAVIRGEKFVWETLAAEEEMPSSWRSWMIGRPLLRLALSPHTSCEGLPQPYRFVLLMHHSLTDGWALPLILQQVAAAYKGEQLSSRPFAPFIEYILAHQTRDSVQFWKEQLVDLKATPFPRLPTSDYRPQPIASIWHRMSFPRAKSAAGSEQITLSTHVRLAWAVLVSQYTDSPDVIFGVTVAGRGAPVRSIETMTGPTIATVPLRVRLDWERTGEHHLTRMQVQAIQIIPHEQLGLQRITQLGPDEAASCQFQSLLVIQPEEEDGELPEIFDRCDHKPQQALAFGSYAITLICQLSSDSITVEASYDPVVISEDQIQRMLYQLEHTLRQVHHAPHVPLKDVETISSVDLADLHRWNGTLPPQIDRCAHELIADRTHCQPDAPAVCAWDGEFTYHQLNSQANRLAHHLVALGVCPETFVPLYFEKSRWTTVAMLGVLKAGAAFVLLDPSHPMSRLQNIVRQTHSQLLITSKLHAVTAENLGPSVVVVDSTLLDHTDCPSIGGETWRDPIPEHPMYAVFTSGSTGEPKGAVMSHGSWCSGAAVSYPRLGLSPSSRVLQFAAYAFDMSVVDNLLTLIAGGCLCVPSDNERKSNLAGAFTDLQANWAILTPSVARILNPAHISTLRHLVLCGEAMTVADVQRWSSSPVQVLNLYGPAECAVLVTLQPHVGRTDEPNDIGSADSAVTWVVNSQDHERLAPIGAVGELVVEGPIIGLGYLNDVEKTTAAFIEQPRWLRQFRQGPSRLYKTGDLVQYLTDGSLRYVGRKDTQVKIRGQRVEMAEVEFRVRQCFVDVRDLVSDLIPSAPGRGPLLAAWVVVKDPDNDRKEGLAVADAQFQKTVARAVRQLEEVLPVYMVPDIFIPILALPLTQTGKVNRRQLRSWAAQMSSETLSSLRLEQRQRRRPPVTLLQQRLQGLYAEVLHCPPTEIGLDDHFFRRGGDSILAMRLVALAREAGLILAVGDVFSHPRLVDLANEQIISLQTADEVDHQQHTHLSPFALLPSLEIKAAIISGVVASGELSHDQIEDIYPCTPMQDGLMALALKAPGKYIGTWIYDLSENLDLERFQQAFARTVAANSILRTRLTQCHSHGSFQVVIQDHYDPIPTFATEEAYQRARGSQMPQMGFHTSLWHAALVTSDPAPRLFLTLHHVLYDGWSLSLILDQVAASYESTKPLRSRPFTPFVQYVTQSQGADEFWRSQLDHLEAAVFPPLPSSSYIPQPDEAIHHRIANLPSEGRDYTLSTTINLAWAIILSQYTDSSDVVFGLTVNGRSASLAGIEALTGPAMATVPFRVQLDSGRSIETHLQELQFKITAMTPYEQTGLQRIRKLSADASRACDFQTHLAVQPLTTVPANSIFTSAASQDLDYEGFSSYAFVLVCHLANQREAAIEVTANYDSHVVSSPKAQQLVEQFEHILRQIMLKPTQLIQEVSAVSPQDMLQLNQWNAAIPDSHNYCLHELVFKHANDQPNYPAISAWDGKLSYEELRTEALRLAGTLHRLGVGKMSIVPICFEKTRWGIVTMLAVLAAGAALVCIDPKYPSDRLQHVLDQVRPSVILVSPGLEEKMQPHRGQARVLTVPMDTFEAGDEKWHGWTTDPTIPAFIVFTSGSTASGITHPLCV
ncbi:hypothetical protein N7467_004771 [Penicillium canescens]|nr:hypothetical protein N7467_004771 [Penicillium canescens]